MNILIFISFIFFAFVRLLTFLHIFQQEEYDNLRFVRWIISKRAFDKKATFILILACIAEYFIPVFSIPVTVGFVGLLAVSMTEINPTKLAKKKLVLTSRARRIFGTAFIIIISIVSALFVLNFSWWNLIIVTQGISLTLVLANLMLKPLESRIQNTLWNDARNKLERLNPTVIGITGSYGKTSVKHILGHLLNIHASTLVTPGSVNTPMGIARVIREQLSPHHKFFVCEMGAYGIGSIKRLCDLAPPDLAVITAIGPAHYERFKSLNVVAQAKFELYDAVSKCGGKTVAPSDIMTFDYPSKVLSENSDRFVLIGNQDDMDCQILSTTETSLGVEVIVRWKGVSYSLKAPLYGEHHARNIALAFATACTLGVNAEDAVLALTTTPQIKHRFEVKRQSNGVVLIDDAYNSNPAGFSGGLRSLSLFVGKGGRCILVTPGMVELGVASDEEHSIIGRIAAECVDILIPIMPKRIQSLVNAYQINRPQGEVIPCESFADAQKWMAENVQPGDVVLLENDLPDIYDKNLKL